MAPLSRELSGVILPHDSYGSHLNASGKTVDADLEKRNFAKAAQTLAEIWSQVVIDGHTIHAEFVDSDDGVMEAQEPDINWVAQHVRQSQYLLQIVKCTNPQCCRPMRSSWLEYFPQRFLPGPVVMSHDDRGLYVPPPDQQVTERKAHFTSLAQRLGIIKSKVSNDDSFDLYCPSISRAEIGKRTCAMCGIYHPSQAAARRHKHVHDQLQSSNTDEEVNEGFEADPVPDTSVIDTSTEVQQMPIIRNLFEWLKSSFVADD